MSLAEIYDILDSISAFELQEEWDNSGLLIGDKSAKIDKIYLSLDLDIDSLVAVDSGSLVIVHHPLIFKGIKKLEFNSYPANLIKEFIRRDISLIAMHTNFDKTHLNRYLLEEILGFRAKECNGEILEFDIDMEFEEFLDIIAKKLNIETKRVVKTKNYLKSGSIVCGSGCSFLPKARTDIFLSGDVKFHDATYAKNSGISLIDIGHYESEKFFADILEKELQKHSIEATWLDYKNPFSR